MDAHEPGRVVLYEVLAICYLVPSALPRHLDQNDGAQRAFPF